MLRVPDHSQDPTHYEWTPAELVRTNDFVVLSAIEALLTGAHIPHLVTDRNVSVLAVRLEQFHAASSWAIVAFLMLAGCWRRRGMRGAFLQREGDHEDRVRLVRFLLPRSREAKGD